MANISCPKCGAPVEYDVKDMLVRCNYCSTGIYIDRSGAGFYYILPFTLDDNAVIGTFRRWGAGSTKAKDLDRQAQVRSLKRQFFPVYLFKRDQGGVERVYVEPAASTTLPGLHSLKVPAGDMRVFDKNFDAQGVEMIKPDIEMLPYLNKLPGAAKEQALVFFPIFILEYSFNGIVWKAVLSGTSGEVFASEFPRRSSASYVTVAGIGFLAFIAEGFLALVAPTLALGLMGATIAGVFLASLFVARRF
jgi:hypothetical protein